VNITVFERSSYVGGRSTTVNAYDVPGHPVELGASIFVSVNEILMNATKEFGLDLKPLADEEEHETIGIWNGEKFVLLQTSGGWEWWNNVKMFWKYGMSPIIANKLMKATVAKFLKLYEPPFFPFRSLSERVVELDLISATGVTGDQLLISHNVYPPFTTDIIQAFTRVNYLQNLGVIHGLETMVSMATDGATQVKGGNWQIFDRMLNASGATVYLDTAVSSLEKNSGRYTLTSKPAKAAGNAEASEQKFDSVVIAAPFQYSGLKLSEGLVEKTPDEIPYVQLHATLFTTPLKLDGSYFGLKPGAIVPTTVYTTLSPSDDPTSRTDIVGKAGFFSISALRSVTHPTSGRKEIIYKIFSSEAVTNEFLGSLFGITRKSSQPLLL
jgi:prenylcysteine oxidase/farnesylcysteine lyase